MSFSCDKCNTNLTVISAPFYSNFYKWCIYRSNGVEVCFSIIDGEIKHNSAFLTAREVAHIKSEIIPRYTKINSIL